MAFGGKKPKGKTIVNEQGRIVFIGDLHGCVDEAMEMLDLLKVTHKDTVIFLGDLIDRGPDNDKCVDLAMAHESIMANHEDRHCRYILQEEAGNILDPSRLPPSHAHTRSQLLPHHYEYFKTLPHFIRLPQYDHVAVHGGCFPGKTVEEQDVDLMIRLQYINPHKSKKSYWAAKRPVNSVENEQDVRVDDSFKFWTHWWDGPETIVFGHSVLNEPLITHNVVGIDGGCVFGHELWAYVLPEKQIYRIKSKMPKRDDPPIHMITDTVGTY